MNYQNNAFNMYIYIIFFINECFSLVLDIIISFTKSSEIPPKIQYLKIRDKYIYVSGLL